MGHDRAHEEIQSQTMSGAEVADWQFSDLTAPSSGPLCANSCPSHEVTGSDPTEPILSPPTDLPDRYSGGPPRHEKKLRRNLVQLDADTDSLPQPHPAQNPTSHTAP